MCLNDIFMTLFTRHLSLDDCTRLWDVYIFEGDRILIHAAVALFLESEIPLLGTRSAVEFQRVLGSYSKFIPQVQDDDVFIRRVHDMAK